MEGQSKAKLVDAAAPGGSEHRITATVSRSEIESTLESADPAVLVLDIARRDGGSEQDVQAHTLELTLEKPELERLLQRTEGNAIALGFNEAELELALGDVEAHGLREKAAVLTVVAATAAGVAGGAAAMTAGDQGGATAPISATAAPISDVLSGGPAPSQAPAQFVTDATSSGPAASQAADQASFVTDVTSGGPATSQPSELASFVTDATSSGPATSQPSEAASFTTDVTSGGPAPTQSVEASGGGGGINISPQTWEAGGAAAGLALLITGAGFAASRQRRPAQA
jgi:hypothetical protein